jgi:hypothetical protein
MFAPPGVGGARRFRRRVLVHVSALATCVTVADTARAADEVPAFATTWCPRVELGPAAVITTVSPEHDGDWQGDDESTARGLMLRLASSFVAEYVRSYRHRTFRIGDYSGVELVLGSRNGPNDDGAAPWLWGRVTFGMQGIFVTGRTELAIRTGLTGTFDSEIDTRVFGAFGALVLRYRYLSIEAAAGGPAYGSLTFRLFNAKSMAVGATAEHLIESEDGTVTSWHGRAFVSF